MTDDQTNKLIRAVNNLTRITVIATYFDSKDNNKLTAADKTLIEGIYDKRYEDF